MYIINKNVKGVKLIKFIKAYFMKFMLTTTALIFSLTGLFQVSIFSTVLISFILTSVTYIGDVLILPNITNLTAAITDYLLIVLIIGLLGYLLITPTKLIVPAAIISSFFVLIGELYFHYYMRERVVNNLTNKLIKGAMIR